MIGVSYNTQAIKTDVNGKPIPQYFDPLADEYKPLLGAHGAARAILYGPDGQPITNENPLEVRVRQLETLLGALNAAKETNPDAASATLLSLIRGLLSAAAKETTLEAIKSTDGIKKIADAVTVSGLENLATETKLEAVRTLVEGLKSELILVKSELETIKANQLSGDQKVQLSGTIAEVIKEHVNQPWLPGSVGHRFGDNYTASPATIKPVDVSRHQDLLILFTNGGDKKIDLQVNFTLSTLTGSPKVYGLDKTASIASGATMIWDVTNPDFARLGGPVIGLFLAVTSAVNMESGSFTFRVLGRRVSA